MSARSLVVLVALCIAACGSGAVPTRSVPAESGVDWARRHALPIDVDDDARTRATMDEIATKKVVYLGEPDHYVQEKYAMRLLFVRRLFARGWRRIGLEMGRSDGAHVDAYLASGEESELDKVGIYAPGGVKTPRSGTLKGLPRDAKASFVAAEKSFCRELRKMSEARPSGTPRLRFFGFDVDTDPLAATEQMAARLPLDNRSYADLRVALAHAATTDPATLTTELTDVAARLAVPDDARPNREDVATLADSWRFATIAFHDPTNEALVVAHGVREKTMYRQLDAALASHEPLILMGHDMHLDKASTAVHFSSKDEPGAASWRTVGTYVAEKLPHDVYAIWMLVDHGRHFDVACDTPACEFTSKADTVEHVLASVGPFFAFPLRDAPAPFAGEVNWQQNGRYASGPLNEQTDLVYFVAETTQPRGF